MPPAKATKSEEALAEIQAMLTNPAVQRFALEAMEPLPADGPLRSKPSGEIVLELADLVVTFRCPTLGEYRTIVATEPAPAADPVEGEEPTEPAPEAIQWWRFVAGILGDHELPPDEALPMWLANPVAVRQAQNLWILRPTQAPGT